MKGRKDLEKRLEINDEEAMRRLGQVIGETALVGHVFAMDGDLGAGKTTLTQGIAKGLNIKEQVSSPTFTIMQVYDSGRLPLMHMDAYRIESLQELDDLGYEEYFYSEYVVAVEWAEKVREIVPGEAIHLQIAYSDEAGKRDVILSYDETQDVWMDALFSNLEGVQGICIH